MPNPFVHVELNTTDVAKAKKFYGKLFDWELEDMPMGGGMIYTMIKVGKGTAGGIVQHPMPGKLTIWIPYVHVEDIKAATKKAKAMDAEIIKDVTEIPGMGWLSIFIDPTGGVMGLWKPDMHEMPKKKKTAKKKPKK